MSRLTRLEERRVDPMIMAMKSQHEAYAFMEGSEAIRFIIGSMQPIDPAYTANTYREGDRVKNQLEKRVVDISDFEYQGSVPSDTHIRAHSDIDLLAFIGKYHFCKYPLVPENPYQGDEKADIRSMRSTSARSLDIAFPEVNVNNSGSTAISLEGGSLSRKVDVVPAVWEESLESKRTGLNIHRGVKVFDKENSRFKVNYPFKSLAEIDTKDKACLGGMRKASRLMKSVKAESGTIKISSYDITALAWNMPNNELWHQAPNEIRIFEACRRFLRKIIDGHIALAGLRVPDGTRLIFCDDGASVDEAQKLLAELDTLAFEIAQDQRITTPYDLMEIKAYRPAYEHRFIAG